MWRDETCPTFGLAEGGPDHENTCSDDNADSGVDTLQFNPVPGIVMMKIVHLHAAAYLGLFLLSKAIAMTRDPPIAPGYGSMTSSTTP